ncbi:MAG: protein phosphatase CheZ [Desulfobulbaceae bacterium]|nr:protein phosphatase CheZ [Desulfobulbaceae bacterium]HIJ78678.1 chemotaxis protein CheZ [Deltaproteobacteria bacterium]
MPASMKSEINLEISTGFFRISTEDVVYNITVLDSAETGAAKVVKTILAQERKESQGVPAPQAVEQEVDFAELGAAPGDDYYKQVSSDIYHDIGSLAKSLSATIMNIPAEDRRTKRAELDEAGEKIEDAKKQLQDIVSMTEKATMEIMDQVEKVQGQTEGVKELLSMLKNHEAFQGAEVEVDEAAAGESGAGEKVQELQAKIAQANELVSSLQEASAGQEAEVAPPEAAAEVVEPEVITEKKKRYLFEIDTIFQTMYELCTNEPVKGHITSARGKAGEIFDKDLFIDTLGDRIKDLEADSDNFFTVPLTDVLQSLNAACSDGKVQNLLKKMDINQGDIFLDQSLPLEVPPVEEIEVEVAAVDNPAPVEPVVAAAPVAASAPFAEEKVAELAAMMAESAALAAELEQEITASHAAPPNGGMGTMTLADQQDIFQKIEDAFQVTTSITDDVTRITEALSFQDLSGQQILKIIKLLSDFQVQLLAIVVSFGSQLKSKEKNVSISHEESKRLAQEEVDKYLKSMGLAGGDAEAGPLDQDAVNSMLEEFGF